MSAVRALLIPLIFVPALLYAQLDRGSIVGTVSDPTAAAIPGVKLVVTNTATQATYEAESSSVGQYLIPNLPAGLYSITFEASGFKKLVRSNLEVRVADTLRVDVTMAVGSQTESVEVTAEATRLETDSPTLGTTLTTASLQDLPLDFAGVRNAAGFPYKISPGVSGSEWQSHVNGSQIYTKDALVDGASITTYMGGAFSHQIVSLEALQELNAETNGLSAEFGHSQGGIFNFSAKSGANELHGSVYGALHNEDLDANSFSNKARGFARPADRKQNYAFSFGGPIYIPKVYNGRNKTFFYATYERYRERTLGFGAPSVTLPQPEFYNGDFSRLLGSALPQPDALGRTELKGAIYDPLTFRQTANGTWVGDMFPNNTIPVSRFSTVAQKLNAIAKAHYLPQVPMVNGQYPLTNNGYFPLATQPILDHYTFAIKIDQNINEKHKISGFYNYAYKPWENNDQGGLWDITDPYGGPLSKARWQRGLGQLSRINYDYTLNPTMMNHLTINYNRYTNPSINTNASVDGCAQLGITGITCQGFPYVNWGAGPAYSIANVGYPINDVIHNVAWGFGDTFNLAHGRHFMKAGFQMQGYQINNLPDANPTFGFASRGTAIPNDPNSTYTGFSFASYLLGIVDNASLSDTPILGGRRRYYAVFFQDDFKVNSRLSLQLGIRWEHQPPATEVVGRMASWNPTVTDPLTGLPGAYAFGGNCNGCTGKDYFGNDEFRDWGPRIGFAYRPFANLVLRGAYGIVYSPDTANNYTATDVQTFPWVGAYRFSNNPITPWTGVFNWDNGFPQNAYQAPGFNRSFADTTSGGMSYLDPRYGNQPYVQEWNINVQREIFSKTFVDIGYVGSKSTGLYAGLNRINQIPWADVQKYGTNLTATIASPADAAKYGIAYPYPGFNNTLAAALRQYPQVYGAGSFTTINGTDGFSSYNSMQITVNRQVSKGLQVYANYVWSKDMSNLNGPLDVNNRRNDRAIESFDQPQMVKMYVAYELPLGKGHTLLGNTHGILNELVNGWSIDEIGNYFVGTPLGFSGTSPMPGWNGGGNRANVAAGPLTLSSFDSSKFDLMNIGDSANNFINTSLITDPGPLHMLGTGAPRYAQVRNFPTRNEDVGLQKINRFGREGKYRLKLRIDALNALNRHTLGGIDTNPTSPTFGKVTSVSGYRTCQVVARFDF